MQNIFDYVIDFDYVNVKKKKKKNYPSSVLGFFKNSCEKN